MTLFEFNNQYSSENACLSKLLELRAKKNDSCLREGCPGKISKHYKLIGKRKGFYCKLCYHHYFPMAETTFAHSHVSLLDWFNVMFKILYMRNGVSAMEIHRETGYSYRTIYKMFNWIRQRMGEGMEFEFDDTFVEIDEGYISTGNKGYSRHHYFGTGRGSLKTTSILAIVERAGRIKLFVIPDTKATTLTKIIIDNVSKNTKIFTDSFKSYNVLRELGYTHATVNHDEKEWVNKETGAGTNCAENVFSNFKRNIKGSYRKVSPHKLQLYLNEQAFRINYRDEYDYGFSELLNLLMKSKCPIPFNAAA